jgi:hypothetical protein
MFSVQNLFQYVYKTVQRGDDHITLRGEIIAVYNTFAIVSWEDETISKWYRRAIQ